MIVYTNEDCMSGMARYPDKYFDLAIVDPPYFSGPERREYYGTKFSRNGVSRTYTPSAKWDVPGQDYFDELMRVSKHYIIWGCNYFDYNFGCGRIVWDKCNGTSSYSDAEIAATDMIESVRLFPFMWNGMMQGRSMRDGRKQQPLKCLNEKRIHPTQKPVALYSWLLEKFAKQGWKILDTHVGSASSLIACHRAKLDAVGFELDPAYYSSSKTRLEREMRQVDMYAEIDSALEALQLSVDDVIGEKYE